MSQVSSVTAGDFSAALDSPDCPVWFRWVCLCWVRVRYSGHILRGVPPLLQEGAGFPLCQPLPGFERTTGSQEHWSGEDQELSSQRSLCKSQSAIFQLCGLGPLPKPFWHRFLIWKMWLSKDFKITHRNPSNVITMITVRVIISEMEGVTYLKPSIFTCKNKGPWIMFLFQGHR